MRTFLKSISTGMISILVMMNCADGRAAVFSRASVFSRTAGLTCSHVFLNSKSLVSQKLNPLYSDLMKVPLLDKPNMRLMDDTFEYSEKIASTYKASLSDSQEQRYESVRSFKIGDIFAAPGHRALRNPGNIKNLVEYIRSSGGGDFAHDPILINLIVKDDKITSVDLWNAHHRLIAYLEAGYKTFEDIKPSNFKILVNGRPGDQHSEMWGHFISAGGLSLKTLSITPYSKVPVYGDIRVGTISVDGALSNLQLGSRNSIAALLKNTFRTSPRSPKVGVYFGTFDPIHEGHVSLIMRAKAQLGLDEVVVIPNGNAIHKPNASGLDVRLTMLKGRLEHLQGINLMTGDTALITDNFGRDPLFEKIKQIYGTEDIFQIIGQDSFENLLSEGVITNTSRIKYLVFKRAAESAFTIPIGLESVTFLATNYSDTGNSSTMVRSAVKNGIFTEFAHSQYGSENYL